MMKRLLSFVVMLVVAAVFGAAARAEVVVTESTDGFDGVIVSNYGTSYTNTTARVYSGEQTNWSVLNGRVAGIKEVTDAFGEHTNQQAVILQYNSAAEQGSMTSGYIVGLKQLKCKMAAKYTSTRASWQYSLDGTRWVTIGEYPLARTASEATVIALPSEVLNAAGVYLRVAITNPGSGTAPIRVYVDDIFIRTEVVEGEECANCFPVTF